MTEAKGAKDKIAGKAKRLIGEIAGDQKLDDEGKAQQDRGHEESRQSDEMKPFGNLDKLT